MLGAGCGGAETPRARAPSTLPDAPPTKARLAQIHSTAAAPYFWLGPAYGGRRLTRATLTTADPPDSIFQYGRASCRASVGCSYELGVATLSKRSPDTTQRCWSRLGAAFVLGCARATTLQVYTGAVEVFLSSPTLRPARVVRALRLKEPGTIAVSRLSGLAAPRPFTCERAKLFPPDFRVRVPVQLAPRACPG